MRHRLLFAVLTKPLAIAVTRRHRQGIVRRFFLGQLLDEA
jgi:hypothetical protein